ncbi:hypothetical protein F070042J6_16410 [Bacteroides sp. f07]|uniref:hypothetical protein n=1 Tax=Bacteroides sp. f07 TaxID=3132704 RepID=UPI0034B45004
MLLGKAFLFTENKTSNRFEIGSYLFDPITQTLMHAGIINVRGIGYKLIAT